MTQFPYPFNHKIDKYPKITDDQKEKDLIKEKWIKLYQYFIENNGNSNNLF